MFIQGHNCVSKLDKCLTRTIKVASRTIFKRYAIQTWDGGILMDGVFIVYMFMHARLYDLDFH